MFTSPDFILKKEDRITLPYLLRSITLAMVYFLLAKAGLMMNPLHGFASLVWPPSGLGLAVILLLGPRYLPSLVLGASLANLASGAPLLSALFIGLGNALGALTGTFILEKIFQFDKSLARPRDILELVFLAGPISSLMTASIGTGALLMGGGIPTGGWEIFWKTWWVGDSLGILVITPVILLWMPIFLRWEKEPLNPGLKRVLEGAVLSVSAILISFWIFFGDFPLEFGKISLPYFIFPFINWASLRFQQKGGAAVAFLVCVVAISGTMTGNGPFVEGDLHEGMFNLEIFMAVLTLTGLVLGAVAFEGKVMGDNLRESRDQLQIIFQGVSEGITLQNSKGQFVLVNDTAAKMVGYEGAHSFLQASSGQIYRYYRFFDEYGGPFFFEEQIPWKTHTPKRLMEGAQQVLQKVHLPTGQERWIKVKVMPILNQRKKIQFYISLWDDITEIKQSENRAKEATKIRDEFFSIASHELKTPMTALTLNVQLLERLLPFSSCPSGKILRSLKSSLSQVHRLNHLVDNLLDVSRIKAGKFIFNFEEVDLSQLLRESLEEFREGFKEVHQTLTVNIEDKVAGNWDRDALVQVFANLFSNAIKYAPESTLKVTLKKKEDLAICKVEDEGPGISQENQKKIFQRFERVITQGENHHGLGLGLYIVREIVESHGGNIAVESKEGVGTSFIVELPMKGRA